jgi:hypothetical protein
MARHAIIAAAGTFSTGLFITHENESNLSSTKYHYLEMTVIPKLPRRQGYFRQ